jgi:hypothetical protein
LTAQPLAIVFELPIGLRVAAGAARRLHGDST